MIGLGEWNFNARPAGWSSLESTDVFVSYTMDQEESRCCNKIIVRRYVRKILGGGLWGPYFQDGDDTQSQSFLEDPNTGYAPCDRPEGPGIGVPFTNVAYRFYWEWDFLYKAECVEGKNKGKILSTTRKFYWAEGHSNESEFKSGFKDVPTGWPDLTIPIGWTIIFTF